MVSKGEKIFCNSGVIVVSFDAGKTTLWNFELAGKFKNVSLPDLTQCVPKKMCITL